MSTTEPVPARLSAFLAAYVPPGGRAFDWPTRNCAHFACAWVAGETGRDLMQGLPLTADARAALRLVEQLGGSLGAAFRRLHAGPEVAPALAQTGDVALVATEPGEGIGEALGIVSGRHVILLDALGAAVFLPLAAACAAWRLA